MVLASGADRGHDNGHWGAVMAFPNDYYPYKEAVRQLERILDAAANTSPDDPLSWRAVDNAVGRLLDNIVSMITEMATPFPETHPGKPTIEEMRSTFEMLWNHFAQPRERALTFIENWPKEYRRQWGKRQTREQWFLRVLEMYAEMGKGVSRKQALENIGETEETIQKHVALVRKALERGNMDIPQPKRSQRVKSRG